jgi:hypothetical protein
MAKMIGDELQASKVDGAARGWTDTGRIVALGDE